MTSYRTTIVAMIGLVSVALTGCWMRGRPDDVFCDMDHYHVVATSIEYPELDMSKGAGMVGSASPQTLRSESPANYWDLPLKQAIELALMHSSVLKDLGGTVLRAPDAVQSTFSPAIQDTDPRQGVEAALSAFDAQYETSFFFEKNDRVFNNQFIGIDGIFVQNLAEYESTLRKQSALGTEFVLRNNIVFNEDNSRANRFVDGAWDVLYDAEMRQPLLQGAGLAFNRIAGPDGEPGLVNGVLIGRVKMDMSLAEFQMALRDFVSDVENAYWDLYFAYRDLDAKITARDAALETWRRVKAVEAAGRVGGEAEKEAQAREQYFRFQEDVQNALSGRLVDGTETNNGSGAGTFRATGGVQVAERRLRLLMGVPISDDQFIRPSDEPVMAEVTFDWYDIMAEAMTRRAELRRQQWLVKQRELEMIAAKNFLLPSLDLVGRYRWRGFGDELIRPSRAGRQRFDNAFMDLTSGDFQEWQAGVELSMPIGFRQAHAAVRNAELNISRDRAVLCEQQRQIIHDLSNAVAEKDRAYVVMQTTYNRQLAAREQLRALQAKFDTGVRIELDFLLDAQRRVADTQTRYYQALIEHVLAVKNLHYEKGSLLDYSKVHLAEGPWPGKAYQDAMERDARRGRPLNINYRFSNPPLVRHGHVLAFEETELDEYQAEEILPVEGDPELPSPARVPPAPVIEPVRASLDERAEAASPLVRRAAEQVSYVRDEPGSAIRRLPNAQAVNAGF